MVKNLPAMQETWVRSLGWEERKWQPTRVFLPGEFHGQSSLVGYSPWSCKESDTTEWLTLSFMHSKYYKWCVFPGGSAVKKENLPAMQDTWFNPWVRKIPWRWEWVSTPVFLPRKPHGQRSLAGYSPGGHRVWHNWATDNNKHYKLLFSLFANWGTEDIWEYCHKKVNSTSIILFIKYFTWLWKKWSVLSLFESMGSKIKECFVCFRCKYLYKHICMCITLIKPYISFNITNHLTKKCQNLSSHQNHIPWQS